MGGKDASASRPSSWRSSCQSFFFRITQLSAGVFFPRKFVCCFNVFLLKLCLILKTRQTIGVKLKMKFSLLQKKIVENSRVWVEKNIRATSFANRLRVKRLRENHTMTNADKNASLWRLLIIKCKSFLSPYDKAISGWDVNNGSHCFLIYPIMRLLQRNPEKSLVGLKKYWTYYVMNLCFLILARHL